ncbi:hypothetical protein BJP36_36665 [Moorena producens JHB]|uniref:Uncharacterized protein n=1 Tax=Moorena producens (strain JHB) TaxID=1454205 RepID=A0A9Q9SU11_MOOP1|nr:hypothetical protein [Moorena producens]WAN69630.1 hypothetical protein BJP36_36665 [Moorena producens JHB]
MARIAINDLSVPQESESFLTELNDTDVAMDQINGGLFGLLLLAAAARRGRRRRNRRNITSGFGITFNLGNLGNLGNILNLGNNN